MRPSACAAIRPASWGPSPPDDKRAAWPMGGDIFQDRLDAARRAKSWGMGALFRALVAAQRCRIVGNRRQPSRRDPRLRQAVGFFRMCPQPSPGASATGVPGHRGEGGHLRGSNAFFRRARRRVPNLSAPGGVDRTKRWGLWAHPTSSRLAGGAKGPPNALPRGLVWVSCSCPPPMSWFNVRLRTRTIAGSISAWSAPKPRWPAHKHTHPGVDVVSPGPPGHVCASSLSGIHGQPARYNCDACLEL
jgi:hypothetical protein